MYIWAEFQSPGNDIQILFFLLSLSSPESPEDWFKYGGYFREKRKIEQVQSPDEPFLV